MLVILCEFERYPRHNRELHLCPLFLWHNFTTSTPCEYWIIWPTHHHPWRIFFLWMSTWVTKHEGGNRLDSEQIQSHYQESRAKEELDVNCIDKVRIFKLHLKNMIKTAFCHNRHIMTKVVNLFEYYPLYTEKALMVTMTMLLTTMILSIMTMKTMLTHGNGH